MGVNAAVLVGNFLHAERKKAWNFIRQYLLRHLLCVVAEPEPPGANSRKHLEIAEIAFRIWKTNWFRRPLFFEAPAE